jgi:hypothetical protein
MSSVSFLYSSALNISDIGKPAYLYYFDDHDPSGVKIDKAIERRLREFAPDAEIHFERIAVLPWQIEEWSLPTRPTKRDKNMHAKTFKGDSVEVDAIEPTKLRSMVRECIEQHVDMDALDVLKTAEESEKQMAERLLQAIGAEDEQE